MEKRKPFTLSIGGKDWRVIWEDLGKDEYGECDPYIRTIKLAANQPADMVESTLFHEIVHAALATAGLDNIITGDQNEAIAYCLENLMAPLYKRKKF